MLQWKYFVFKLTLIFIYHILLHFLLFLWSYLNKRFDILIFCAIFELIYAFAKKRKYSTRVPSGFHIGLQINFTKEDRPYSFFSFQREVQIGSPSLPITVSLKDEPSLSLAQHTGQIFMRGIATFHAFFSLCDWFTFVSQNEETVYILLTLCREMSLYFLPRVILDTPTNRHR